MKINYFLLFLFFINAISAQNSQTHKIEPAPEENHWYVKKYFGDTLNYRSKYYCKEVLNDSNFFALYTNGKLLLDGDLVHYFTSGKEKVIIPYKQNKVDGIYKELLKESAPMDLFYFDSVPIEYYLRLSLYFYNAKYVEREQPFKQGFYLSNDFGNDFWHPICYFDAKKPELEEENQEKNNNSKYAGFDFSKEAEIMPGFPGGKEALRQYISECLIYPRAAAKKGEEGKVFVGFVIDVDGSIKNVHIERGVSKMLDAEAVRVVKSMPKWKPAFDGKGKPVPFSHFIPVNFRLK